MRLSEIRKQLEEIEQKILQSSFENRCSMEELAKMHYKLIKMKNSFLSINFQDCNKEELEEIRIKLKENLLNIKISIKEKIGVSFETEILQMKELFY